MGLRAQAGQDPEVGHRREGAFDEAVRVLDPTPAPGTQACETVRRPAPAGRDGPGEDLVWDLVAFLMDEPLSNLDAKLRVQMRTEAVPACSGGSAPTTVYVTHDETEAMTLVPMRFAGHAQRHDRAGRLAAAATDDRPGQPVRSLLHRVARDLLAERRREQTRCTRRWETCRSTGRLQRALERANAPRDLIIGIRPQELPGRLAGCGRRAEQRDHLPARH